MLKGKLNGKRLAIIVTLLVGVALLAGSVPALAQNTTDNSTTGLRLGRNGQNLVSIVSDILGISKQDLAQERHAGKSLVDIAAARNVDKDQLVKAVMEKRQDRLNQALQSKQITQEQYDQCIQTMKAKLETNLTRTQTGPSQDWGQRKQLGRNSKEAGNGGACRGNCWQQ